MNTSLREYIDIQLLPALYDRLDSQDVLPEFAFRRNGTKCVSTTQRKHSGRDGKTKGQVVVYQNNPGFLIDHSEARISQDIIGYIQRIREGKDIGFITALHQLADMVGIEPYKRVLSEDEKEAMRQAMRRAEIWEHVVNYCRNCIQDAKYKAEAAPIIEYLTGRRNYSGSDIEFMQLGYLRNTGDLFDYLLEQGIPRQEAEAVVKLPVNAGGTHRLAIPVRNASGHAVGLTLRNAQYTGDGPKYINNSGLKKTESLYNLNGKAINERVVLVEGPLDAGIASARGYEYASVAALMGKSISREQIAHLERSGAKKAYICLDNEKGTLPDINKIIESLISCEFLEDHVYIVQLPDGIKDVDELVTQKGIDAFNECVRYAIAYYDYLAEQRIDLFNIIEKRTDSDIHELIDDIERIAAKVNDPIKREDLKGRFIGLLNHAGIPVTHEAFTAAIDRIRYKEDEDQQRKQLGALISKGKKLLDEGNDPKQILEHFEQMRQIKQRSKRAEFDRIVNSDQSEAAIIERMQNVPEAVETGFQVNISGEQMPIMLPAGQLTFVGGVTGHGKSTVLANWALNIVDKYPDKKIYFFTFEVGSDETIIQTLLNPYVDIELNRGSNRKTILQSFRKKGNLDFVSAQLRDEYSSRKQTFFKKILPRIKVINVEYSANELIEFIEYIRKESKDAVIMIDYIQKLRSDRKGRVDARFTELKFVCEDLNACAMRTGLPIVLGAQFNRTVLSPFELHPQNLSEASDIEKIASEIIGVWNCTIKPQRSFIKAEETELYKRYGIEINNWEPQNSIIVKVLKSRSMSTGHEVKLKFNGNTGKIGDEYFDGMERLTKKTEKKAGVKWDDESK